MNPNLILLEIYCVLCQVESTRKLLVSCCMKGSNNAALDGKFDRKIEVSCQIKKVSLEDGYPKAPK